MIDPEWLNLFLIFIRMSSFFVPMPFFTLRGIPGLTRIGLAALLSYLIFNTLGAAQAFIVPQGVVNYFLLVVGEVIVGLTVGFTVLLVFGGIRIAGQMVDMQMGFLMAGVFDPQFGSPVTLMGQFYYYLSLIYFFIINGHHSLLAALAGSYRIIPIGLQTLGEATLWKVMEIFFWMFILAFQIALPVVVTLLLVDVSLGLISKTVPQVHVFMVGLPLKTGVGMAAVVLILPLLGGVFENIFSRMITDMLNLMGTF